MDGYTLSRQWFDFAFDNPDKNTSTEWILYMWIVENWNRNWQKEKFWLPTFHSMCACGIKSPNTYHKALKNLISYGFIKIIQESKNQNTSTIITLSAYSKIKSADKSALDSALIRQVSQQVSKPEEHNKQINKEQINKEIIQSLTVISERTELELLLIEFKRSRAKLKRPMTDKAMDLLLKKLSAYSEPEQIAMLEEAIEKGWQSVYPPKQETKWGKNIKVMEAIANYNFT